MFFNFINASLKVNVNPIIMLEGQPKVLGLKDVSLADGCFNFGHIYMMPDQ